MCRGEKNYFDERIMPGGTVYFHEDELYEDLLTAHDVLYFITEQKAEWQVLCGALRNIALLKDVI